MEALRRPPHTGARTAHCTHAARRLRVSPSCSQCFAAMCVARSLSFLLRGSAHTDQGGGPDAVHLQARRAWSRAGGHQARRARCDAHAQLRVAAAACARPHAAVILIKAAETDRLGAVAAMCHTRRSDPAKGGGRPCVQQCSKTSCLFAICYDDYVLYCTERKRAQLPPPPPPPPSPHRLWDPLLFQPRLGLLALPHRLTQPVEPRTARGRDPP
jgi:hypothetical protein